MWMDESEWPCAGGVEGPLPASVFALSVGETLLRHWVVRVAERAGSWSKKLRRVALVKKCLVGWIRRHRGHPGVGSEVARQGVTVAERAEAEKIIPV